MLSRAGVTRDRTNAVICESSGSIKVKPGMPASGMPSRIRLRTASSEPRRARSTLPIAGIARRHALAGRRHTRPDKRGNLRKFRLHQSETGHARIGNAVADQAAHGVVRSEPLAVYAADSGGALAAHAVRAVATAAARFEPLPPGRERIRAAGENERAEVLGYMVRIAIDHTGGLPAEEMPPRIGSLTLDAIEICAPLRAGLHGPATDRAQRDARGGIPDVRRFIDARGGGPSGAPGLVVALVVEVDGQIDPIARGGDLEFAIVADVCPVVSQEHLDHVAIPELVARAAAQRGQEDIQLTVRTTEEQIEMRAGPERSHLSEQRRIVDLPAAIVRNSSDARVAPDRRRRVGRERRIACHVRNLERRGGPRHSAGFLRACSPSGHQGEDRGGPGHAGCTQGARYGRASSRLAASSPAIRPACGSQGSVRPSFIDILARMQLAVEMYPSSISMK